MAAGLMVPTVSAHCHIHSLLHGQMHLFQEIQIGLVASSQLNSTVTPWDLAYSIASTPCPDLFPGHLQLVLEMAVRCGDKC